MTDIYCPLCGFELTEAEAELIAFQVPMKVEHSVEGQIADYRRYVEHLESKIAELMAIIPHSMPTFTQVVAKIRSLPEGAEVVLSAGEIAAIDNAFPTVHPGETQQVGSLSGVWARYYSKGCTKAS